MNLRELAGVVERNDRGKQDLEVRSNEIRGTPASAGIGSGIIISLPDPSV